MDNQKDKKLEQLSSELFVASTEWIESLLPTLEEYCRLATTNFLNVYEIEEICFVRWRTTMPNHIMDQFMRSIDIHNGKYRNIAAILFPVQFMIWNPAFFSILSLFCIWNGYFSYQAFHHLQYPGYSCSSLRVEYWTHRSQDTSFIFSMYEGGCLKVSHPLTINSTEKGHRRRRC